MTLGISQEARRKWRIRGQVQGVGFRPFVYREATDLGLSGTVRNDPGGVFLDAWGPAAGLRRLEERIRHGAPPLAQVDDILVTWTGAPPDARPAFRIVDSDDDASARGRVTTDSATCDDCLSEMRDAEDARHGHPLINCTNCGPRYTIVRDLPYDRPRTTMAGFAMCERCGREYADPTDRRFHAQPICCPDCGPVLRLEDASGRSVPGDPIENAARRLDKGRVLAMKGLGGYHLVVDATNRDAVRTLRSRKKRDFKPFAIMVRDVNAAREIVELSGVAEAILRSPASPIVLATRRDVDDDIAHEVAPGSHRLGVMIPHTPMQHLLMSRVPRPLVMTSANLSDEPLVKDDDEAISRLAGICDDFLRHDRPIERAVDDSIVIDAPTGILPIRRARGFVPRPIELPIAASRPGLCIGADLKNTVAVVRGGETVSSQHLGDVDDPRAYARFEQAIADLQRLFEVTPEWIACDMHPAYLSRRHAKRLARETNVDLIAVQHHHAHVASLLAEHGRTGPIVGLVCDGVGYGTDGTAWGGEILVADLTEFRRVGRIRPLRLPGGDAAAKETGRCAASWLADGLGKSAARHPIAHRILPDDRRRESIFRLLREDLNCPASSGLGRLYDAAASLLALCNRNHYEAMSGLALESAAARSESRPSGAEVIAIRDGDPFELDHRPLLEEILRRINQDEPASEIAWLFHDALADGLFRAAVRAAECSTLDTVGLTGGVFCNALLTDLVTRRLRDAGLRVLLHETVPPNDGGLALGQAAIVAACLYAN